jgi:hypothetical protein
MIRPVFAIMAAAAPLAAAQEAAKPVAAQPSAVEMARKNLDAVAPSPVVTPPLAAVKLPFPTVLEFPLCARFPGGPSLVRDGDTWKIRMRPGEAPLPAK